MTCAKRERIDKQYYISFKIVESEVVEMIKIAEEFNSQILDFTERLNNERIILLREKFRKMIKK